MTELNRAEETNKSENLLKKPKLEIDDEDVLLSVQGSLFILNKSDIIKHDWMLAKIFSSQVPFKKVNDQYYIDVDPSSFRILLSILRGLTTLENELTRISTNEINLLFSTAQYLMLEKIEKELGTFLKNNKPLKNMYEIVNSFNQLERKSAELNKQFEILKTRGREELIIELINVNEKLKKCGFVEMEYYYCQYGCTPRGLVEPKNRENFIDCKSCTRKLHIAKHKILPEQFFKVLFPK